MKKTNFFKLLITAIFCLLLGITQAWGQDAEMGWNKSTTWTVTPTTYNSNGNKEVVIIGNTNSSIKSENFCAIGAKTDHSSIDGSSVYFEANLTSNSATSNISSITLQASTNQTSNKNAAIVYSNEYQFNTQSIIDGENIECKPATNACDVISITPPEGTKSFRIYRRIYYWAGTNTINTNSGSSSGRIQLGDGETIRLANIAIWVTPAGPTLTLTSAAATTTQSVSANVAITSIAYTYGGTADGYELTWTNTANATTPPAGITVTPSEKTVTISGEPTAQGSYGYTIKAKVGAAADDGTELSGSITVTAPVPTLTPSVASLAGFAYVQAAGGPSASQSFTLSGANLTSDNIVITGSTNYEVSLDNADFGASKSFDPSTISAQTIYVRLKNALSAGAFNENISISGGGVAAPISFAVSGSVTGDLVAVTDKTWSAWGIANATYGTSIPVFSSDYTLRIMGGSGFEVTTAQIKLGGKGDKTERNVAFKVTGPSIVRAKAISSSAAGRPLEFASESGVFYNNGGTVGSAGPATDYTGYYTGNGSVIYIYSKDSGININEIEVTPLTEIVWNGSTDVWNLAANWNPQVIPTEHTNVRIPGSLSTYPVAASGDKARNITFAPGAELGRQDLLTYDNAFVQYDLSYTPKTWRILSMPLTYATAKVGEFTFENKQPPVKFLKFKAMNNNAGWEAVTNKETTIAAGDAFAYGVESHDGALLTDQILELPRNSATGGKLVDTSLTKEYDNGNDEIDGTTGAFAVAGNPFMSTISYDDLQDENSGVINASGYYVWDGTASSNGAFVLQEVSESDEDLIAPLQGFVVFGNATGDNKFSLTFDPATLAGSGGGVLKSSSSPAKLTVSASNGTASTRAVILNKENGGTTFNSNVDLPKLMSGASDVPEIYTLKQTAAGKSVALGINVVNTDNIVIPLGISTSTDNIKLTFSGMDTYNAVVTLYDRSQVIDLTGQETAEYTLNNYQPSGDNSLYISLSPRSTTEAAAADASAVTVYSSNGAIYALSTAANPIVSLSVYNLQGALVSSSVVNAPVYTGNVASAGIYVVKVVTTQGVQSVKLISN